MPLLPLLALAVAAPQMASAPACPATPAAVTGELSGWAHSRPVAAATRADGIATAVLQPGVRAQVALQPSAQIRFAMTPQKAPAAASFSGLLGIDAAHAGTYRIALGSGAWVDVIGSDGKALASVAHAHGPDCSGIRKVVDFTLQPGRYVVQIEGSSAATIGVLLAARA